MKQIVTVLFLSLLLSCGASKTVKESRQTIKGEWVLNTINYSQAGTYKVSLFNDVSKACFEQSTWQFIPNNYSGTYTIDKTACNAGTRNFNLLFKK